MRILYRVALRVCPALALLFSVVVTATTMYIIEGISPALMFVSVQVYLNWYCIYSISRNATTMKSAETIGNGIEIPANHAATSRNNVSARSASRCKYWYCDKCRCYTYKPTQHCGPCKRCFHFRDHHCFFIGGCILRQNMGNFILVCFYTSLACLYSLTKIGPHLYSIIGDDEASFQTFLRFCFPVALAKLLVAGEDTHILLVTLFDTLFSVFFMCLLYGAWKLHLCLTGKQRYYPHVATRQSLKEIFGSYGLSNFVFPYNGLLGTRDIDGKYVLKEV